MIIPGSLAENSQRHVCTSVLCPPVDMRHNGAVYDILDFLGLQLFQHPYNPAITVAQVRLALSRFQVCPDDRRFVAIYDSAQRQFIAGPPALTSVTGTKVVVGGWVVPPLQQFPRTTRKRRSNSNFTVSTFSPSKVVRMASAPFLTRPRMLWPKRPSLPS
jgi:hypothetical protein